MEKKKKGIGKWIVIAVVVIAIIGVAMGGGDDKESKKSASEKVGTLANSDSDTKKDAESQDTSSEDVSDTKEDTSSKDSAKDEEDTYHPGDVISFGDFEITYKSAKNYKSKNQFSQPKDGYKYVRFAFKFKNQGDADAYPGSFGCYVENTKCEQSYVDSDGADFALQEISSGRELEGTITFEVPKTAKLKDVQVDYENLSLVSDKKIMFIGK